jgi:peptidoglycan/LPS O-acetylase OafA/YrhL
MSLEKRFRFDLLDGLRGLAAIAVMVHHFTQHNGLHWLGGAWVAVDLFFILSGFVIAHSYGIKLLAGMPLRQFLLIRLNRLGPLYFFGLLIGLIAALLAMRAGELGKITPFS